MRLTALAATAALLWGVTGCGGEPPPYDDGSQVVPLAGLGAQVEAAGFEVVDAGAPTDASPAAVVKALDDAGFDDSTTPLDVTADDDLPAVGSTAGLIGLVGPGGADEGTAVVLVFTSTSAAAVYAASDPQVLSSTVDQGNIVELISGNLVGFAPTVADGERTRDALRTLAGVSARTAPSVSSPTP